MTEKRQKIAEKKIVPRRPKKLFRGSESQHPLDIYVNECDNAFSQLVHLHECRRNIRPCINDSHNPAVVIVVNTRHRTRFGWSVRDTEIHGP